jgi:hypothetical protein
MTRGRPAETPCPAPLAFQSCSSSEPDSGTIRQVAVVFDFESAGGRVDEFDLELLEGGGEP